MKVELKFAMGETVFAPFNGELHQAIIVGFEAKQIQDYCPEERYFLDWKSLNARSSWVAVQFILTASEAMEEITRRHNERFLKLFAGIVK